MWSYLGKSCSALGRKLSHHVNRRKTHTREWPLISRAQKRVRRRRVRNNHLKLKKKKFQKPFRRNHKKIKREKFFSKMRTAISNFPAVIGWLNAKTVKISRCSTRSLERDTEVISCSFYTGQPNMSSSKRKFFWIRNS